MKKLADLGHDPSNRLKAMELAQDYGSALYTGLFYRNPNPPPTYGSQIAQLQGSLSPAAPAL
jgi:2-oxoglutarate ferredoxin oxidoreductase subunit beta